MANFRKFAGWSEEIAEGETETAEVAATQGWLNGVFSVGCILGAASSAFWVDKLGRRGCLMLMALVFAVGGTMQLATPNLYACITCSC